MILMRPTFHGQFRCIGGQCTDNCCIGWEIDIDREALARYRAVPGEFGDRLRRNIVGEPPHFRMEGERCALLNEDNLCEIILWGGEQMLCEICAQHPRFRAQYGDRLEVGAGLCCEVAARQWLCGEGPVRFEEVQVDGAPKRLTRDQQQRLDALLPLRAHMLALLAADAPLGGRLSRLVALAERAQEALEAGRPKRIGALCHAGDEGSGRPERRPEAEDRLDRGCIALLKHMEPIDGRWSDLLERLEKRLDEVQAAAPALAHRRNAYARMAAYAVYRYLLKGVFDRDVLSRAKWAALMPWIARRLEALMALERGGWDASLEIEAAKLLSKQVEYSQENMTLALSECWNSRWLTADAMTAALIGWEG